MESVQLDNRNSNEETFLEQSSHPDSPDIDDVCGHPQVNPRLGDEYQVEIPPMITEFAQHQLLKNPAGSEVLLDIYHSFLTGLPVPIMWIHEEVTNIEDEQLLFLSNPDHALKANGTVKSRKSKKNHVDLKEGLNHSIGPLIVGLKLDSREASKPANLGHKLAEKINFQGPCKSRSYPLPGSLGDPWGDADVDAFLLGLYLFRKNFGQVKRFIEKKMMGDILSFYYGVFYRSDKYRRWSDCRKTRSRRCVYGRKIFTGWRLHKFLSRLRPHVPDELQNTLLEVSKSFEEGETPLEQFMSSLKNVVGIQFLVEAVGIGKGKEDLTGLVMEPVKTNQMFPLCPIMPTGKGCSSLTSSDIIEFLTGGIRLSKARCNDIFWEAVWPRLLARGWHSEQPWNQGYKCSKNNLVFLVPGIKKFSRRKLVKGDHYFDSVSDVLSKVASKPNLIELEADETKGSSYNEQDGWIPEVPSDQDAPSNHQPHHYLKPRVSTCIPNCMKFLIVDSSSAHGRKSSNVRELRNLPVDNKIASKMIHVSRKKEGFFPKLDEDGQDAANMLMDCEKNIDNADHSAGALVRDCPDCIRFTVVDTSLAYGGKSSKVRELRYVPIKYKVTSKRIHVSLDFERISHEDSADEHHQDVASTRLNDQPDAADMSLNVEQDASETLLNARKTVSNPCEHKAIIDSDGSNQRVDSNISNKLVENDHNLKTSTSDDNHSKRIIKLQFSRRAKSDHSNNLIKLQFSRRAKSDHSNNLVPLMKRQRLTACAISEAHGIAGKFSTGLESKQLVACCGFGSMEAGNKAISQGKVSSISFSSKCTPEEKRSEGIFGGDCFGMDVSRGRTDRHQPQSNFGLNLQLVSQEYANGEPSPMEVEDRNRVDLEAARSSVYVGAAEQQPSRNHRRQSTRNRPLTIKALEALESGFFNFQNKPKSKEVRSCEIPFSSPSRKARSKCKISSNHGSAGTEIMKTMDSKALNKDFLVREDAVSKPLERIKENWLTIY